MLAFGAVHLIFSTVLTCPEQSLRETPPAVVGDEGAGVDGAALLGRCYERLAAGALVGARGVAAASHADGLPSVLPRVRCEVQVEPCKLKEVSVRGGAPCNVAQRNVAAGAACACTLCRHDSISMSYCTRRSDVHHMGACEHNNTCWVCRYGARLHQGPAPHTVPTSCLRLPRRAASEMHPAAVASLPELTP